MFIKTLRRQLTKTVLGKVVIKDNWVVWFSYFIFLIQDSEGQRCSWQAYSHLWRVTDLGTDDPGTLTFTLGTNWRQLYIFTWFAQLCQISVSEHKVKLQSVIDIIPARQAMCLQLQSQPKMVQRKAVST